MKKSMMIMLVCLLLCSVTGSALANSWGLRGGVYDIVCDDDAYDAYSADAETENEKVNGRIVDIAIMTSRYHSQLIAAVRENKTWRAETISTAAVYQPGDERGKSPELSFTNGGFRLSYGDREWYLFDYVDGRYILREARFGTDESYMDSLMWEDGGYVLWESGREDANESIGDARWHTKLIALEDFSIAQLPRSMADVRRMNTVREAIQEVSDELFVIEEWHGVKKGSKLAVYSAPDESSYRASGGKASVSTGGSMKLYGEIDGWTMVEYEVSLRTSRIGFVKSQLLSRYVGLQLAQPGVTLVAARNAFLTDDPHVSQYLQFAIPAGTEVQALALLNDFYALVTYQSGKQTVWGFVPLRDLALPDDGTRWDVMDRMIGKWQPQGSNDLYVLYSDGACRIIRKDEDFNWISDVSGTWRVTDRPADAVYGEKARYEIAFTMQDGSEEKYGLVPKYDGAMTLMDEGGEVRYEHREYSTFGNG